MPKSRTDRFVDTIEEQSFGRCTVFRPAGVPTKDAIIRIEYLHAEWRRPTTRIKYDIAEFLIEKAVISPELMAMDILKQFADGEKTLRSNEYNGKH